MTNKNKKLILTSVGVASAFTIVPVAIISCSVSTNDEVLQSTLDKVTELKTKPDAINALVTDVTDTNLKNYLILQDSTNEDVSLTYKVNSFDEKAGKLVVAITATLKNDKTKNKTKNLNVLGFKSSDSDIDKVQLTLDKVTELNAKPEAINTLASSVTNNSLSTFITLPTSSDSDVELSYLVKSKEDATGKLVVTVTASLITNNTVNVSKDLTVTGFKSTDSNINKVQSILNEVTKLDVKSEAINTLASSVTNNNLNTFITLPTSSDSDVELSYLVKSKEDATGKLVVTVTASLITNNTVNVSKDLTVTGFKSSDSDIDKVQLILDKVTELNVKPEAINTLASSVTNNNLNTFITLPTSSDSDVELSYLVKSNEDATGKLVVTITASLIANNTVNVSKDLTVTGFKSLNDIDINKTNKINGEKERLENLSYTATANNEIFPSEVALDNLSNYGIDNLPVDNEDFIYAFDTIDLALDDATSSLSLKVTISLKEDTKYNASINILIKGFVRNAIQVLFNDTIKKMEITVDDYTTKKLPSEIVKEDFNVNADSNYFNIETENIILSNQNDIDGTLDVFLIVKGKGFYADVLPFKLKFTGLKFLKSIDVNAKNILESITEIITNDNASNVYSTQINSTNITNYFNVNNLPTLPKRYEYNYTIFNNKEEGTLAGTLSLQIKVKTPESNFILSQIFTLSGFKKGIIKKWVKGDSIITDGEIQNTLVTTQNLAENLRFVIPLGYKLDKFLTNGGQKHVKNGKDQKGSNIPSDGLIDELLIYYENNPDFFSSTSIETSDGPKHPSFLRITITNTNIIFRVYNGEGSAGEEFFDLDFNFS